MDLQTLCGPGASPVLLQDAGISDAELIIAVTNSDEINMLACQIGDRYGVETKIARVSNPDYFSEESGLTPQDFGIDLLVNPEHLCVEEFIRLLKTPEAREVVDFEEGRIQLAAFRIKQGNPFIGKSLSELDKNGVLSNIRFAAINRRGEKNVIIPRGSDVLKQGDDVFVIGSALAIEQLFRLFGIIFDTYLDRVIIVGASAIGIELARTLEDNGTDVKLIESDEELAELASTCLKRTTVLEGDFLQFQLLEEAGIEDVNGFVSVTGDDENDIMACMTAKEHGAQRALALIQQPRYLPLLARIPRLDGAVSRHLTVVSNLLRLIRRGNIVSVASLHEIDAEVIEIVTGVNAKIAHKELGSLRSKFPDNAFIGAILRRENLIIPHGETVIQPADRVIVFSMPEAIPVVEDMFAARRA
ncbi:Trk system potassium transporter TrkA [Candidatus Poribacteria bacterium]|nr:Trk system potassium transporter TrkA [Candidatus Poribacteria bacterium]